MTDVVVKMTFPMPRQSKTASRLKAVICDMLPLSDDVLSEYITVLVCNGKSQRQVREDLEAFLGEKSEDFVACLWKFLLKKFSSGKQENSASEFKSAVDFSSHGTLIEQVSSRRRHNNYNLKAANTTYWMNEKRIAASLPIDDVEANVSPIFKNMKMLQEELVNSPPRKLQRSQVISAIKQPCGSNPAKYEKEFVDERNEILQKRPYFPVRDIRHMHSQYSPPGGAMSVISHVSVWDRLSRPKSDLVLDDECPTMPDFGSEPHENEMLHQYGSIFPAAYNEHSQTFQREVPEVGCSFSRKRSYGITYPNSGEASAGEFSSVLQCNQPTQVKRPKLLSSQSEKPHLLSEILTVKQKLLQIERLVFQSERLNKQKNEELNPSSQSGKLQNQQDATESTIVHVTNVHYAASKEPISMLFSKCGAVKDVTVVTDPVTRKPKGAAFVTFATKESVNKAIALSGTMFYSRPIKVRRHVIAARGPATGVPATAVPATAVSATRTSPGKDNHGAGAPILSETRVEPKGYVCV